MSQPTVTAPGPTSGSPFGRGLEVFLVFLRLGLTSFGGPVAHLGYFRETFVQRRRWLDDAAFADLVALCQFLPGPASSQVGFAIGLIRGGVLGAAAAWLGFTLPSALLMTAVAYGAGALKGALGAGLIHGLKLAAVAVVAQAVLGMARTLAPDRGRAALAAGALVLVSLAGAAYGQVSAIALGGGIGLWACRGPAPGAVAHLRVPVPRPIAAAALVLFLALLAGGPLVAGLTGRPDLGLFAAVYRSGALVFGGGHVVLPLLRTAVVQPGWVSQDAFLSGYAAAQALPGPLFAFAAYLGVLARPGPGGLAGAALATAAIFLPGLLLLIAALPVWSGLRARPAAQAALAGANAAVVGVLAAALYDPVWTSAIARPQDVAVAGAAFTALVAWRAPPGLVVAACAIAGLALTRV